MMKIIKLSISLILLTLIILGILKTLNTEIGIEYAFFILYFEGLILSLILYGMILNIRDIFYRKVVKIKELQPTKLDIQTSAFKDLEYGNI